jgi:galactokinase
MFSHNPHAITIAGVGHADESRTDGALPLNRSNSGEVARTFEREFHAPAQLFRAPGRVNLIGEHTDYNDGFVLPSAIGFYTQVAISPRDDHQLVLMSTEYDERFQLDVSHLPEQKLGRWCDYVVGVGRELVRSGHALGGANLLVHGEVPVGAGLSSSASLEVASALALASLSQAALPLEEIARLCQRAENQFVGARVGIMDQFVSCFGKEQHAVLLDCRSLQFELVPVPAGVTFVIANTMVKHQLAGGEYNRRREECEAGVRVLAKFYPGIQALRDVSVEQLAAHQSDLPPVIYRRCQHVVQENARTLEAARRFRSGDLGAVGRLMHASHESLRDLYQVSCRELDVMVETAESLPGFIGGRMTGGGFGGCSVNLVEPGAAESFSPAIASRYREKTGITPEVYICSAANGAGPELMLATA